MSGLLNNEQNPNLPPEPDSEGSENLPETLKPVVSGSESALPDSAEDAGERPQTFRTSAASAPNLADFLATQRPDGSTEAETLPNPVFKVSPAEPNWSYTIPPPEEPLPAEDGPSGWQTAWAIVREVGETILLTLIIFFLIQTVIRNFRVVGTSMVDNLHNGQYLIIDKLSYTYFVHDLLGLGGPKRGDVVVFEPPNRPGEDYVKRIIGLPGETVEIKKGKVFINGQPMAEPFQPTPGSYTMPNPVTVPPDQVFVLGDNRNNSNDSHNWGTLPIENIVGRAWLSYWPPDRWGAIPRDAPTQQATLIHLLQEIVPGANAESE